jgi:RNA-directed DNA polymerase
MAKGGSKTRSEAGNSRRTPVNTAAPWPDLDEAESRVLHIQAKLHRWAAGGPNRRFDDLYNLVCDPAVLLVGWMRVRRNKGARSAGVDGVAPRAVVFAETMLTGLRAELKARVFQPVPVRERRIPKANGKSRRLGIATVPAYCRVVQHAV